jgi:hypothetical protein
MGDTSAVRRDGRILPPFVACLATSVARIVNNSDNLHLAGALGAWLDRMEKEFPQPILQEFFADPSAYAELAFILAVALLASVVPARAVPKPLSSARLKHHEGAPSPMG